MQRSGVRPEFIAFELTESAAVGNIGRAEVLKGLGITPVHELRAVGENLRDHYSPRVKFAITARNATFNDNARGWRLAREAIKYALWGEGFLASTAVPIRMYFRTRPGLETPDATISIAPFLYERVGHERRISARRGITMNVNVLRSESLGSIHVKSADPATKPALRFNYLSTEQDRREWVEAIHVARSILNQPAFGPILTADKPSGTAGCGFPQRINGDPRQGIPQHESQTNVPAKMQSIRQPERPCL